MLFEKKFEGMDLWSREERRRFWLAVSHGKEDSL
jgi:hypothetical protein